MYDRRGSNPQFPHWKCGDVTNLSTVAYLSGRRDLNSQHTAWKAVTLPLSYFRICVPVEGLEPPCLSAPRSKRGVYAFHHTGIFYLSERRDLNPQLCDSTVELLSLGGSGGTRTPKALSGPADFKSVSSSSQVASIWANCEGQTHDLSLTRRLLYHWAKLAFHFQYCKYTKWFPHFQIYFELDGGFAPPYMLLQSTAWLLDQSSICMDGRTQTCNLLFWRQTLYQLSYTHVCWVSNGNRTRVYSVTMRGVCRYTIDTM